MPIETAPHMQPHESLPPANAQESGPVQGPQYKFVFWRHTPENAKAAAKHVEDCEIVAMEFAGTDDIGHRHEVSQVLTAMASSRATQEDKDRAEVLLHKCDAAIGAVMHELEGSDKQIVAIDMTQEHPQFRLVEEMTKANQVLHNALRRNASNRQLKRLILASATVFAKSSAAREPLLSEDLRSIAAQPGSEQKKIGVLLGGVHTPVQHELSREAQTERVFEDMGTADFDLSRSERARYFHDAELIRQLRFRPDAPVSDALLNRLVVENTYDVYHFGLPEGRLPTGKDYSHVPDVIQATITEKMSDAEISALLESLDRAKAGITRRFKQDQITANVRDILEANRQMVQARTSSNDME